MWGSIPQNFNTKIVMTVVTEVSFTVENLRRCRVQNAQTRDFTEHHRATQNPSIRTFVYYTFSIPYEEKIRVS